MQEMEQSTEVEEVVEQLRSAFILSVEERLALFEWVLELANHEYKQSSK